MKNTDTWGAGYRQFKENIDDLYSNLKIKDLGGLLSKKLPGIPEDKVEEIKGLHVKYVDSLTKNEDSLGKNIDYFEKIQKSLDALKKAKSDGHDVEKQKEEFEEAYKEVKDNIINFSKALSKRGGFVKGARIGLKHCKCHG